MEIGCWRFGNVQLYIQPFIHRFILKCLEEKWKNVWQIFMLSDKRNCILHLFIMCNMQYSYRCLYSTVLLWDQGRFARRHVGRGSVHENFQKLLSFFFKHFIFPSNLFRSMWIIANPQSISLKLSDLERHSRKKRKPECIMLSRSCHSLG